MTRPIHLILASALLLSVALPAAAQTNDIPPRAGLIDPATGYTAAGANTGVVSHVAKKKTTVKKVKKNSAKKVAKAKRVVKKTAKKTVKKTTKKATKKTTKKAPLKTQPASSANTTVTPTTPTTPLPSTRI